MDIDKKICVLSSLPLHSAMDVHLKVAHDNCGKLNFSYNIRVQVDDRIRYQILAVTTFMVKPLVVAVAKEEYA